MHIKRLALPGLQSVAMPSITFACCALLSLVCGIAVAGNLWSVRPRWWLDESRPGHRVGRPTRWALRQRFLLDLLLQVHKPLLQQELLDMARELNDNPSDYEPQSWPLLQDFFERVEQDRILRPYSLYSLLQEELPQQLLDVYRFLVLAKDWRSFQRNACYARSRFNPVLFVHALQLALAARADTRDLMMPTMHEVLPQLYFDKDLIRRAKSVNWQELTPVRIKVRRSWAETLGSILYPKVLRQPAQEELMPVDPIVIEQEPSTGAQLSLDPALNGFWSRLISRLIIASQAEADYGAAIIDGDRMMAFRSAQDEWTYRQQVEHGKSSLVAQLLLRNIQNFVALLRLEELATGTRSAELITPTLMTTGGVPYKATALSVQEIRQLISKSTEELQSQIDKRLERDHEVPSMLAVSQVIASQYWRLCRQLSLAINGDRVEPNLLGMTTSNLRDPIYRSLLIQIAQIISQYEVVPQTLSDDRERVLIRSLEVDKLETFDQLVDTDLINLIDQQLLQSNRNNLQLLRRRLVARHSRLNHSPFSISYELYSPNTTVVLIRSYLVVPGKDQSRLLLNSFVTDLQSGENRLKRHFPTASNEPTLSDLYEAQAPLETSKFCSFPDNFRLPRGTTEGLALKLLVQVHQWNGTQVESECEWTGGVIDDTAALLASDSSDVVIYHKILSRIADDEQIS